MPMHTRLSRLIRRTGSPANSPYAGFHFDVAAVTPQSRIPKRTAAIPDSWCIRPVETSSLLGRSSERELRMLSECPVSVTYNKVIIPKPIDHISADPFPSAFPVCGSSGKGGSRLDAPSLIEMWRRMPCSPHSLKPYSALL